MAITHEQEQCSAAFATRSDVKISAYAGTGKTFTLTHLASTTQRRGLYFAYNKAIADEAKKKFKRTNVDVTTIHAKAYHTVLPRYGDPNKLTNRVFPLQLAQIMELKPIDLTGLRIYPPDVASMITHTVQNFCQSGDRRIDRHHVHELSSHSLLTSAERDQLGCRIIELSQAYWDRAQRVGDPLPLGHDGYLKLWSLDLKPDDLPYEYLMLDEAQDANPVILDIMRRFTGQRVYVGDQYQQIYEWRGAANAMQEVHTDHDVYLTKSFRFCPEIANLASYILSHLGADRPIVGNEAVPYKASNVGGRDTYLCRTNAGVLGCIVALLGRGVVPHIVGGHKELDRYLAAIKGLKDGIPSVEPEFYGFANWEQVKAFAESDAGEDLLGLVNMVERNGVGRLRALLYQTTLTEKSAQAIVSTLHRAKGREWPSVVIENDFTSPYKKRDRMARSLSSHAPQHQRDAVLNVLRSELRLLYVGITRAEQTLTLPKWAKDVLAQSDSVIVDVPVTPKATTAT